MKYRKKHYCQILASIKQIKYQPEVIDTCVSINKYSFFVIVKIPVSVTVTTDSDFGATPICVPMLPDIKVSSQQ